MIVIAIIGILMAVLLPSMARGKYQAHWSSCSSNERNLAAALESYRVQSGGYPSSLSLLTASNPKFISLLPNCPSNGVGYSNGYEIGASSGSSSTYDTFTISCQGAHSLVLDSVSQGFPQYSPTKGLDLYGSSGSQDPGTSTHPGRGGNTPI